jgi:hypothetical protein
LQADEVLAKSERMLRLPRPFSALLFRCLGRAWDISCRRILAEPAVFSISGFARAALQPLYLPTQ